MNLNNAFIMTILGLVSLIVVAHTKDVEVTNALVTLLIAYIAAEKGVQASSVWASSKDPAADTNKTVEMLKDK